MTRARAAQLPAFALLASLLIVAGPDAGLLTAAACLAITGLTMGAGGAAVVFRLPGWVFRALTIPVRAEVPVPHLARAWWIQSES